MVWGGVAWCDVVWCGVMWCDVMCWEDSGMAIYDINKYFFNFFHQHLLLSMSYRC